MTESRSTTAERAVPLGLAMPMQTQMEDQLLADQAAELASRMGLLPREYETIRGALGRIPTRCELAVFTGMWSEHCSYKSTRRLLATLPRSGPQVLAGPGSHAGVVDVGEGWAVAFKIESHNHPSAVEPYQGAATGVGGILRDVIAQGARPCAILDFLCFGDPTSRATRRIERGVIDGIAGYGNAIGVPNLGGRTHYDAAYEGNPLVNALAAGLIRPSAQRTARAEGVGSLLVIAGAATGRDGILGAAFASTALGDESGHAALRSHTQIGDPFAGKQLMEALLAFSEDQGLVAMQDLGACGIACASFEMAALGGVGLEVELDAVPLREPGLSAVEILLSESQERFALILRPEALSRARSHFQSYGVACTSIGRVTDSGRVRIVHRGRCYVDLPAQLVAGGAPDTDWPLAVAPPPAALAPEEQLRPPSSIAASLLSILAQTPCAERIYSHFDQTVGNRTVRGPDQAAAAVLRLPSSTRGFALTLTGRGDLCAIDPYRGAQAALAEAVRRLACVGAPLLAVTDGLNFASPRDAQVHRAIVEVIRGLGDGLRELDVPVTGGNVSLYNQSPRGPIPPTPMIGGLGVIEDVTRVPTSTLRSGQRLVLLGTLRDEPSASLYLRERCGRAAGAVLVDLQEERRLARFLCAAVAAKLADVLLPVTRGGILTTLAKACVRSSVGARLALADSPRIDEQLFGEFPAQAIAAIDSASVAALFHLAEQHNVSVLELGQVGSDNLLVCAGPRELVRLELRALQAAFRSRSATGAQHAA